MDHSTTVSTSVATQPRSSSFRRIVAATLTAALAAGGLSVIAAAAPASATVTGGVASGSFSWNVSDWSTSHLSTRTTTGSASLGTGGVVTWTGGTGTINPTTGVSDIAYSGSAKLAFVNGTTEFYQVTVADPEVVVDASGAGTIIADVSWAVNVPSVTTGTTNDVVVARFQTGDSPSDGWTTTDTTSTMTDIPFWDNTIAPGSADATAVGITDPELPYSGQAFTKEFLLALPSSLRAHFYSSKSSGNPNPNNQFKDPSVFTATATTATPVVTPTVTSETFEGGYVVSVAGDGFRPALNPGDSGVYVGIAPAGGHPGYASADIAKFVVADWVNATAIVDGKFTRTLTADATKLDPSVAYSIYTWQAHTHSNTTQDTETLLTIDYDALERYISGVTLAADTTVVYGSDATLTATVANGTGSVEFFEGETSVGTADVVDGVATLAVPDLAVGDHTFSAKYLGDDHYAASTSSQSLVTVERAVAGDVVLSLSTAKQVYGLGTTATVTIPAATGDVALLVDDKPVGTATLADGIATIALPTTLAVGNHSVVASYAGTETVLPQDSDAVALKVNKASASSLTVSGKSYKKNTAPVVTVKIGKLNNGLYANGTVKIFIGSKVVKTVSIYTTNKGTISVTLPKQTKSSIPVKAAYYGSTKINAKNSATVRITRK